MVQTIQNECIGGGGRNTVTLFEVERGWVHCSGCGRLLRIRACQRDCNGQPIDGWEAAIPRHKAEASGYHSLADAANATGDARYGTGPASVWYARQPTFTDKNVTKADLETTHVCVGKFGSADLDEIYEAMQGEFWSSNGEARNLIIRLGLQHTSMSVGDVVELNGDYHVCAMTGWRKLED